MLVLECVEDAPLVVAEVQQDRAGSRSAAWVDDETWIDPALQGGRAIPGGGSRDLLGYSAQQGHEDGIELERAVDKQHVRTSREGG